MTRIDPGGGPVLDLAGSDRGGASLSALLVLLARTLLDLDRRRGAGLLRTDLPDGPIGVWTDTGHVYIEDRRPEGAKAEIDVSAHGRTLFLRIGK